MVRRAFLQTLTALKLLARFNQSLTQLSCRLTNFSRGEMR